VNLGTLYRRLVEPLDIANYYKHSKNEDTGSYLSKGRPRRYKYTQKWHEQLQRIPFGSSLESCFWAIVEELQAEMSNGRSLEDMRDCQRSGNSEYSSERSFLTCMRMKWKV
jgi:enhanced disease susceptibility 1 protein